MIRALYLAYKSSSRLAKQPLAMGSQSVYSLNSFAQKLGPAPSARYHNDTAFD